MIRPGAHTGAGRWPRDHSHSGSDRPIRRNPRAPYRSILRHPYSHSLWSATGQHVPKRQVEEELAQRAAVDFEAFYQQAGPARAGPDNVLVISAGGKGIVMRPEALRPGTAKAVASKKLATTSRKTGAPTRAFSQEDPPKTGQILR